jgi:hypothetical protein
VKVKGRTSGSFSCGALRMYLEFSLGANKRIVQRKRTRPKFLHNISRILQQ